MGTDVATRRCPSAAPDQDAVTRCSYQSPQAGCPEAAAGAWSWGERLLSWTEEHLLSSSQVLSLLFQMTSTGTKEFATSGPGLVRNEQKPSRAFSQALPAASPPTASLFIINRAPHQHSSRPAWRRSGLDTSPPSTL